MDLAARNAGVVAVDISPSLIKIARNDFQETMSVNIMER